jgi:hypothetical protein
MTISGSTSMRLLHPFIALGITAAPVTAIIGLVNSREVLPKPLLDVIRKMSD